MSTIKILAVVAIYFVLSLMLAVIGYSANKKDFKAHFIEANIFLAPIILASSIICGLVYVILL